MSCMHIMLVSPARRRIGLDSTGRGVAPARPVNRVLIGLIELFALWKTTNLSSLEPTFYDKTKCQIHMYPDVVISLSNILIKCILTCS